MMHKILTIVTLLFALNCKTSQTEAKNVEENIVLIAKGNLYGSGEEDIEAQNSIIKSKDVWQGLIDKMYSVNKVSDSFSEIDIDFSKHTIIAIFDNVKTTGGHSLELDVKTNSENIAVNIIRKFPKSMVTMVMTQPYHIIKISKSELPIVFSRVKN